ncbi:MAG TPA: hypothetical protein VGF55_30780 [Gemmataceae bacterium]|jgi:hypothetical protein
MRALALTAAGLLGLAPAAGAADPPKLRDLRTQAVNGVTYFRVQFDRPADLWAPPVLIAPAWSGGSTPDRMAHIPRLVPQDDRARDVAFLNEDAAAAFTFFGRSSAAGPARFLLLYAHTDREDRLHPEEAAVELDFSQAVAVPIPTGRRTPDRLPAADDLEGGWAVAQADRFAALEAQSPEFGFYGFAKAAVGRRYGIRVPHMTGRDFDRRSHEYERLYELTTGAAALTESLQLDRMLGRRRKEGPRDIDVAKVPGIDIAAHDWAKMMGDKRPDPEPLAKLIPHDNYYLHFKRFGKFVELGDFLDQWGTTAVRAYEVKSTDYRLKERYEKQLCLKTSLLGRTLGPLAIQGVAITGSDPYFREGTDVAVIFHVVNRQLFQTGVEQYVREAQAEFGGRFRVGLDFYQDVSIGSYTTPNREVSLYRASIDDLAIFANSPVGVRRIIDAHAGRIKSLADSPDFQYMRTVFRLSDEGEDGFLFLSDPFIRQLVGPASKIKEKRRLEGLTGLTMATNAALWHAWQTGRPPTSLGAALATAGLTPGDLATPDQPAVTWDAGRQRAASDRYNTLHFATPLAELPIDRVSREEEQDYNQFRQQYLGLWRRYFDPVGMRFRIRDGDVGVETFILPLVRSTEYGELRRTTGDGTVPLDASPPTTKTVAQLLTHLSPEARGEIERIADDVTARRRPPLGWVGDWAVVRFDDSPMYGRLAALQARGGPRPGDIDEWIEVVFQMPVTAGVQVRNPLVFAGVLTALRTAAMNALPGAVTWEPMEPEYKGVKIVRIRATRQGVALVRGGGEAKKEPFLPAVYYALVDGAWYVSLQEQPIKDMIDRSEARGKQPADAKPAAARQVNSALYVSPSAATAAKDFARHYLATQVHERALANAPVWYAFYKSGLITGQETDVARDAVLFNYLGYVPVSPDGAGYRYDPRADEVTTARHGSPRRPAAPALDPDSTLGRLLETTRDVAADLRFREDGVHTTLTIRRAK